MRLVSIAVAAGVLLAIAFADRLPEAFSRTTTARAAFAFAVGLLLLLAIETATNAHPHHHDAEVTGNLLAEVQSEQRGWLLALTFAATPLLAVRWFTIIAPE